MNKIITSLGLVGLACFATLPAIAGNGKTTKYKLDTCFAEDGDFVSYEDLKEGAAEGLYMDLCNTKSQNIIHAAVTKNKVNFNQQYVLVEIKSPIINGVTYFNYIAVNPRTKQGYVLPRTVWFEHWSKNKKPKLFFDLKNNTACSTDPNLEFTSEGLHQSTNAGNKSGGKLCWALTSDRYGINWEEL